MLDGKGHTWGAEKGLMTDWYGYSYWEEPKICQLSLLQVELPEAFLQDKDPF